MNGLKALSSMWRLPQQSVFSAVITRNYRAPSICSLSPPPDKKPCFNIRDVTIQRGNFCHAKMIRSFLYAHYWPREPTVTSLWMALDSNYLQVLTEKYCFSGDRFLAYEKVARTGERKLVGVAIANKCFPWTADELEEWAHYTFSKPERYRMYFTAHCLRSPQLFAKYHVDYIYDIEVLATASEVSRQGVATLLLRTILNSAIELRHPISQFVATSHYASTVASRCKMQREWAMDYVDFIDDAGQRVFFPRRPHHTVSLYVQPFSCKKASEVPCKPAF